ncbi:MAG: hypothetical protein IT292_10355 [Deltaproteobacteria bacterium]|nr:hypothetical protein [Deltaproteobacteria bacterium]
MKTKLLLACIALLVPLSARALTREEIITPDKCPTLFLESTFGIGYGASATKTLIPLSKFDISNLGGTLPQHHSLTVNYLFNSNGEELPLAGVANQTILNMGYKKYRFKAATYRVQYAFPNSYVNAEN